MNTKSAPFVQAGTQDVAGIWAVKHVPSGRYLPAPRGRDGRNGTHVEVDDPGTPRLFPSRIAAAAALRWWLGGKIHVGQYAARNEREDGRKDWTVQPTPHRRAGDMQIVRVSLVERADL